MGNTAHGRTRGGKFISNQFKMFGAKARAALEQGHGQTQGQWRPGSQPDSTGTGHLHERVARARATRRRARTWPIVPVQGKTGSGGPGWSRGAHHSSRLRMGELLRTWRKGGKGWGGSRLRRAHSTHGNTWEGDTRRGGGGEAHQQTKFRGDGAKGYAYPTGLSLSQLQTAAQRRCGTMPLFRVYDMS